MRSFGHFLPFYSAFHCTRFRLPLRGQMIGVARFSYAFRIPVAQRSTPSAAPPIERLWSHLAKGRSFPICSGVGFTATKPRYEPYYCDAGFRLVTRSGDRRNEVGCVSTEPKVVSSAMCSYRDNGGASGRWHFEDGKRVCKALVTQHPYVREQPRYVDVTIDGAGRQRVWF